MSKNKASYSGIVYSTDPSFQSQNETGNQVETAAPAMQKLTVRLEKKHRAGKAVSLVEGFVGTQEDRETIGKKLKTHCGSGGSVKDGEILIQGDHRDKILQWLIKNGYAKSRKI